MVQSGGNGTTGKQRHALDPMYNGVTAFITRDVIAEALNELEIYDGSVGIDEISDRLIVVGNCQLDKDGGYTLHNTSGVGGTMDVAAPGTNILSTVGQAEYSFATGTSMAAPFVSGILAAGWSTQEELSGAEIVQCLRKTASELVKDNESSVHETIMPSRLVNFSAFIKDVIDKGEINKIWNIKPEKNEVLTKTDYQKIIDFNQETPEKIEAKKYQVFGDTLRRQEVYTLDFKSDKP